MGDDDGQGAGNTSPFDTPKCLAASGIYPRLVSLVCHHQHRHQRRRLQRWQPWRDRTARGGWGSGTWESKGAVDNHTKCCHLPFVRFCHLPYRRISIRVCVSLCLHLFPTLSLPLFHSLCVRVGVLGWLASKL